MTVGIGEVTGQTNPSVNHVPKLFQMIQTFSRCVLCCAEEVDLDELLSTRLVSFLMDHHQEIFRVPTYLQVAVRDHIEHVRAAQVGGIGPAADCRVLSLLKAGGENCQ